MPISGEDIEVIRKKFSELGELLEKNLADGVYKDKALLELELCLENTNRSILLQPV